MYGIFEDHYQVSNLGRVRSKDRTILCSNGNYMHLKGKILAQEHHKTNCYRVRLCVRTKKYSKSVHRLVAIAFIPNPDGKPEVNHIDGNRLNNNLENLEWVTQQENIDHAVETGLIDNPFGKAARNSRFVTKVYKDGILVAETYGHKELEDLGFDYRNVYACFVGRQKTHRGHTFSREEK
tara:strand:- start:1487 stop:2026 length:540 start_codon:yes stop_codon:yes gene_type:complete